jgi:hypothetical protein
MRKQRGLSLQSMFITLMILAILSIAGMKLAPAYLEAQAVKRILTQMEANGALKGTVRDIRFGYEKLNAIEDVKSVRGEDLEITKQGQTAIVTANWTVRVPMVANVNACLDFSVSTQ